MKHAFAILFSLSCALYTAPSLSADKLYAGEELIEINHTQSLIKFTKADPLKPLVIFAPGDSHLARIAYGYPEGHAKDFLAYWLNQKGYSFLGVSYPSDNPVYSKVYPSFTIQDWGNLTAAAADKVIKEHQLNRHIVVLGWSMGGSLEAAVNRAAKKHGLIVDVFIGLSAVPPLPYIMQSGPYGTNKILPNKLADRSSLTPLFAKLVAEQNTYNQHDVLPATVYPKEFIGNIPTALSAEGYYYQAGKFVYKPSQALEDGSAYDFAEIPWIALIQDDSPSTAKISLIDPASWNYLRAEMIYKQYLSKQDLVALAPNQWKLLSSLIHSLPDQLTKTVHGNHFFFVGERGARETVDDIEVLIGRVAGIKGQLEHLTH